MVSFQLSHVFLHSSYNFSPLPRELSLLRSNLCLWQFLLWSCRTGVCQVSLRCGKGVTRIKWDVTSERIKDAAVLEEVWSKLRVMNAAFVKRVEMIKIVHLWDWQMTLCLKELLGGMLNSDDDCVHAVGATMSKARNNISQLKRNSWNLLYDLIFAILKWW